MAHLARALWVLWLADAVATVLGDPTVESLMFGAMFLVFASVGLLLALRVLQNPVGWVLAGVGAIGGVGGLAALWAFGLAGASAGRELVGAGFASTLAIAVLFNPLRRRVQAVIDRRFYRRRYNPPGEPGRHRRRFGEPGGRSEDITPPSQGQQQSYPSGLVGWRRMPSSPVHVGVKGYNVRLHGGSAHTSSKERIFCGGLRQLE